MALFPSYHFKHGVMYVRQYSSVVYLTSSPLAYSVFLFCSQIKMHFVLALFQSDIKTLGQKMSNLSLATF